MNDETKSFPMHVLVDGMTEEGNVGMAGERPGYYNRGVILLLVPRSPFWIL